MVSLSTILSLCLWKPDGVPGSYSCWTLAVCQAGGHLSLLVTNDVHANHDLSLPPLRNLMASLPKMADGLMGMRSVVPNGIPVIHAVHEYGLYVT